MVRVLSFYRTHLHSFYLTHLHSFTRFTLHIFTNAVQILRDFKLPEGASGDAIDANGDGEVLAVLDLGTDESLVEAGLAREVVNRVQKLRKKAGLVASDVVDVFLNAHQQSAGQAQSAPNMQQCVESHSKACMLLTYWANKDIIRYAVAWLSLLIA